MTFVLYTNSVSAHQLPLAREIARRVGAENFRYVYTGTALQGGAQEVAAVEPWVERADARADLLEEADALLCGGLRPIDLFERRCAKGRKTFYQSERWFKPIGALRLPGWLRLLVPRYFRMARRFARLMENPSFRYLPIGPWAAKDMRVLLRVMAILGFANRADRVEFVEWGYFVAPHV